MTAVGPAPVSVVLDVETATIESLGSRPLRFVVAQTAVAGAQLWVWSDRPTRIGVGARLAG